MITTVIVLLTVIIVGGIVILDHFAIKEEKEREAAMEKARAERRAAKAKEKELATVKVKDQKKEVTTTNARKETADGIFLRGRYGLFRNGCGCSSEKTGSRRFKQCHSFTLRNV